MKIATSDPKWLEQAIQAYASKTGFDLVDDHELGLTKADLESAVTLIRAAKTKGRVAWRTVAAALAGVGLTGIGVWMIAAAIVDPEPTSKLGLLIGGGVVIVLTGGLATLRALGISFTVTARGPRSEFRISPGP